MLGGQNVKSVDYYKYQGIVWDTELSDDKEIQTTVISILHSKQAVSFFFLMFKCS